MKCKGRAFWVEEIASANALSVTERGAFKELPCGGSHLRRGRGECLEGRVWEAGFLPQSAHPEVCYRNGALQSPLSRGQSACICHSFPSSAFDCHSMSLTPSVPAQEPGAGLSSAVCGQVQERLLCRQRLCPPILASLTPHETS